MINDGRLSSKKALEALLARFSICCLAKQNKQKNPEGTCQAVIWSFRDPRAGALLTFGNHEATKDGQITPGGSTSNCSAQKIKMRADISWYPPKAGSC